MYWFKELKKNRVHALGIIKLGLDAEKSQQSLSLSLGLIFFTVSFTLKAIFSEVISLLFLGEGQFRPQQDPHGG